jgi:hypothetical protein
MAAYTTIDDPSAYFQTTLYSGTGSQQSITNGGNSDLQPDFLWIKERNSTSSHQLVDSSRGFNIRMESDNTSADLDTGDTGATNQNVTSFDSDGFGVKNGGAVNESGKTYVAWQWKKVAGVFDIVTYTGNGSNRTISHNLGAVPTMMITKVRSTTNQWLVYHKSLGNTNTVKWDDASTSTEQTNLWNSTTPTSSVFSVGTHTGSNLDGGTFVMYLFGDKQGVSKMGSYTGNANADGEFIYTGFKPRWIMIKGTNIARNWGINDTKRSPINQTQDSLYANVSDAETGSGNYIDFLSNGFKLRDTALTMNGAYNYIYMAFAENPFVTSTGVPATAR